MKSNKTSKSKASFINLFFNYANASFAIINGLVLVPLYLTYFSVSTYGSYLSSGNIVGMLGLLEGGMSFVLTQRLSNSYAKRDLKEFSKILGSGLFISISAVLLMISIGLILFPFIADWVKAEPSEYRNIQFAFLFSAIAAGLNIFYHNLASVFQALLKVSISGFTNIFSMIIGIASTLVSLRLGHSIVAIPIGFLAKGIVGVLILVVSLINLHVKEKFPPIKINKKVTKDLLKSVLPMFGGGVAKSLVTNSQLLIITNFISPAASAIFFITGRIYQVCDSFLAPVSSSIFSSISQIFGEGNRENLKKNIVKIFFIFNVFSVLILSLSFVFNYAFISLLLGSDKYGSDLLSLLLCINMLFNTRFNFLSVNLYALGVFGKTVMYDVIGGIVRLLIIFSVIKYVGYVALPIAELLSTLFLIGYFLNKLIIKRIGFTKEEALAFIFSGSKLTVIIFAISLVFLHFLPAINSWLFFVLYASVVGLINCVIVFAASKKVREISSSIFANKFFDKNPFKNK